MAEIKPAISEAVSKAIDAYADALQAYGPVLSENERRALEAAIAAEHAGLEARLERLREIEEHQEWLTMIGARSDED